MSTSSQFWWASSSSFSWSLGATQPDASLAIVSWISSIWINRQAKCNCYYVFGGFFLLFELCKTLTAVKNKLITIGGGAKGEDRDRGGDCNRLRFMWFRVKRARLCKRYQGSASRMDELRMSCGWADERMSPRSSAKCHGHEIKTFYDTSSSRWSQDRIESKSKWK